MTRRVVITLMFVAACAGGADLIAQEPARPVEVRPAAQPEPATVVQLMVDVTISRHLNDKTISSTPYTLAVIPNGNRGSLRMGGEVPIPSTTFTPVSKEDGKPPANPLTSFGYRSIGTSIDAVATAGGTGQYRVTLTIDENSIYPPELAPPTTKTTGAPAFRTFKSTNTVALHDGQSLAYTMATDRLTGEVYRVTVKLSVVK
jgi:hypothetical protein